jgi:hypothetical protein
VLCHVEAGLVSLHRLHAGRIIKDDGDIYRVHGEDGFSKGHDQEKKQQQLQKKDGRQPQPTPAPALQTGREILVKEQQAGKKVPPPVETNQIGDEKQGDQRESVKGGWI